MNSSRIISFSQRLFAALVLGVALWIGGCGDFLTDKTAGRESNKILDDLGRVETTTEPNIPMPSIYKSPPKIVEQTVGGTLEFKLFYFCKHLSSAELEAIVHKLFATLLFNQKGKSTTIKDYGVSSVAATNQLIVRCPTREDVDAVLETIENVDIPPIQVKISCLISEVYADKTLDWETTTAIEDLFGENIWAAPSARPFGKDVVEWLLENDPLAAFPGASLREFGRAKMGLNVGYMDDDFMAVVDILESQGYLKILMNPTLEVINGKTAKVSSEQRVPVDKTYLTSTHADYFTTKTEWADIVDSLEITPHVFANGYIGLQTHIVIGSKLTPEGIKQLPIVTKKEITNKETRIRPGESLIIGGLRKSERRDVLRGIPFLKDIPLIGILFSGRDFEERAVETIFILTPTFSTGGIPKVEMTEEVERKHESPSGNIFADPFD
ncbi:MAG: type II secretion system protein GspD, partial [Planctomycetota bacterium]